MDKSTPFSAAALAVALFLTLLLALVPTFVAASGGGDVTDPEMVRQLAGGQLEANPQRTPQGALSVGPDVTIIDLSGVSNYTSTPSPSGTPSACPDGYPAGDCRGYSVGTNSCNIGSVPIDWCDQTSGCRNTTDAWHPLAATNTDVPVIGQSLYRLKDGRFEQLGLSYLKHGFLSTNSTDSECEWNNNGVPSTSCVGPPTSGNQLGVGCTDFYGSSLNGSRPLGKRSQVNVADGDHPNSEAGGQTNDDYDQHIVVAESDLDPAKNVGALYWVQGQYVVRDDARAGNGLNNTSYRATSVGSLPNLDLTLTGTTFRELPVLEAWKAADPSVELVVADRMTFFTGDLVDPPGAGFHADHTVKERFVAARRLSVNDGVLPFHWEIVVQNLNSDTSAHQLVVDLGGAATIGNAGWHGVPFHSGEVWATDPWDVVVDQGNGTVTWSTDDFATDPDANALRWGQVFTFWFDSDVGPENETTTLSTFKIVDTLTLPFTGELPVLFIDGFETGNTTNWSATSP
ncbi:MAG: hypothetical protein K8J08_14255 [Thermoanaerobaculia bacterium]|nr:hypothetical protein [Thermoanaerobaculia bacterium]